MGERITVMGAGNIGSAMAADLSLAGHEVILYELPAFAENLEPILYSGGIKITGVANTGFAKMKLVTTEIEVAIRESDYIFAAVVANAHQTIVELAAPYLRPGQILVNFPGSAGSLVYAQHFRKTGLGQGVVLADAYSAPYAGRKLHGPGTINVHNKYQSNLPVAVFPAKETESALALLHKIYPAFIPFRNVLEVTLYNPNILVHPIGTLLNVGRIEYSKGDFYVYREGFTQSVFEFLEAVDAEKVAVLRALGLEGIRYMEMRERLNAKPFHEFARISSKGPLSVTDRYVTEDVPNGLAFLSSLGHFLGVPTPNVDAVIQIFSAINKTDYRAEGRTMESLELAHLSPDQLVNYVETGEWPA